MDDFIGSIFLFVTVAVGCFGYAIGQGSVATDCDKIGKFHKGDKVYICEVIK